MVVDDDAVDHQHSSKPVSHFCVKLMYMQKFIQEFRRIKIGSRRGFNTQDQREMGRFLDTAIEDEDDVQLDKYIHIVKLK